MSQTAVLGKRNREEDYLEDVKSRMLVTLPPDALNYDSLYAEMQKDKKQKILDDCPVPDKGIPPLSLLYHGFGRFLDFMRSVAKKPSTFFNPGLRDNVDEIMDVIYKCGCVQDKQDNIQELLLNIFFPDSQKAFKHYDYVGAKSHATSNGHILAAHDGPSVILVIKQHMATAEPELAGHFMCLALQAKEPILYGWRQPALGVIMCGEVRYPP